MASTPLRVGATGHVTCESCEATFKVEAATAPGAASREQYLRALEIAKANKIDIPGAYSVLLGVLSVEAVRSPGSVRRPPAPPSFRVGIESSTPDRRAVAVPDRTAAAADRLVAQHGLSPELAEQVARRKLRLVDALNLMREAPAARPGRKAVTGAQKAVASLVLLAGVVAVGFYVTGKWQAQVEGTRASITQPPRADATGVAPGPAETEGEPDADPRVGIEVLTDELGRPTKVLGPDPGAVLLAYCRALSVDGKREAVELTSTVPPFSSARLGIFRDYTSLDKLYAIRIKRDRDSHRWATGNGREPIPTMPAPQLPASAERVPAARLVRGS